MLCVCNHPATIDAIMSSPTSIITIKNKGSVAALVYPALAILAKRKRPKGKRKSQKKRKRSQELLSWACNRDEGICIKGVYERSLIIFASREHDNVGRGSLGSHGSGVSVFATSGLLEETHNVVCHTAEIALAVGGDDAE